MRGGRKHRSRFALGKGAADVHPSCGRPAVVLRRIGTVGQVDTAMAIEAKMAAHQGRLIAEA